MLDTTHLTEAAADDSTDGPTRTVLFERNPRTIRLQLDAGDSIPPHRHPEADVLVHLHEGEIELTVGDDVETLIAGAVSRFDGANDIALHANTDSTALLVFSPKPDSV